MQIGRIQLWEDCVIHEGCSRVVLEFNRSLQEKIAFCRKPISLSLWSHDFCMS